MLDYNGNLFESYRVKDTYFNEYLHQMNNGQGTDFILHGLMRDFSEGMDMNMAEDIQNYLFVNGSGTPGADLLARNIQRGRDHGLPAYNEYRKFCGLGPLCSWNQRPEVRFELSIY